MMLPCYHSMTNLFQIEDTCHIKLDPSHEGHFDVEAVWCSLCQRPRFEDDICTAICVCPSFTNSIDSWLEQAVENSAFENLQMDHYNAVNLWLPVGANPYPNLQTSQYDAIMKFSTTAGSTGPSTPPTDNVPSLAMSAASSRTSSPVSSTSSVSGATPPRERRSPEVDHLSWPQYHRLMDAKQVSELITLSNASVLTSPETTRAESQVSASFPRAQGTNF